VLAYRIKTHLFNQKGETHSSRHLTVFEVGISCVNRAMRKITETHTGKIVSDTDLGIEYLYVGDYGKENNIKADFLGYTKRIEKVKHKPVDITDKLVVTVSSQKGCPMNCNFCDCPKLGFHGNVSTMELISEITTGIALSGIKHGSRLNVHYARMGEPTFNYNVITSARLIAEMLVTPHTDITFDTYHPVVSTMMPKSNKNLYDFLHKWVETGFEYGGEDGFGLQFSINTLDETQRNEMFRNKSLSLQEISDMIKTLPMPKKRKYTLNFAVTSKCNLDVNLMNKYFDKEKCIVKITPIHETVEAVNEGYEIVTDFDVYEKFEQPLVKDGWDVIVFVPSKEEDADRITCGNSLIALANK
jgi:23S rRNA (adenine2503-C2)-methyltransferase